MLTITIPASGDKWDEKNQVFVEGTKETTLYLEHSLISISKWEEIYEKAYLGDGSEKYDKTPEEFFTYIKCMTIGKSRVPDEVYDNLTQENLKEISDYIGSSKTATTITYLKTDEGEKKEVITSELIYAWMSMLGIPYTCEKWFLNRLMALIELTSMKSNPNPKKMSAKEYAAWRSAENQRRRALRKAKAKH